MTFERRECFGGERMHGTSQLHADFLEIDAEHALELLASFTPRLILMDLQLPKMDGLELTRRLKRDPLYTRTVDIARYLTSA